MGGDWQFHVNIKAIIQNNEKPYIVNRQCWIKASLIHLVWTFLNFECKDINSNRGNVVFNFLLADQ